jgi:drug/metabolite transporter (DMT)-like permease
VSGIPLLGQLLARGDSRRVALAAVGLAVLAVSTSAILIRLGDAPKPVMAFYRVLFTIGLVLPAARGTSADLSRASRRDLLLAAVAGLALAAHFATWFESVDRTTVAASVTLVQTQPLFVVAGGALLLGERVTRRTVVGVGLALAGVVVLSADRSAGTAAVPAPLLGNVLAVAGAAASAGYYLSGRSVRQRVSLVPYVLVVYAAAASGLLGAVLIRGHPLLGYPAHEWGLFLGMAVGPGVLGHTLVNWALEHVESGLVSVSLVGEPVGSTILAALVLGELPGRLTLVGAPVVVVGILVTAREYGW